VCNTFSHTIFIVLYAVVKEIFYVLLDTVFDNAVQQAGSDFLNFSVNAFIIIMYTYKLFLSSHLYLF
jgi:hypothetical protein